MAKNPTGNRPSPTSVGPFVCIIVEPGSVHNWTLGTGCWCSKRAAPLATSSPSPNLVPDIIPKGQWDRLVMVPKEQPSPARLPSWLLSSLYPEVANWSRLSLWRSRPRCPKQVERSMAVSRGTLKGSEAGFTFFLTGSPCIHILT